MIDCEINYNRVTLAAIYGPNNDDPRFFHNIKNKLESLGNVSIIAVLDFYGLLSAIPREWKIKLKDCNKLEDVSSPYITYLKKQIKFTKYFTNIQVEKLLPNSIKSQQKWEEKLHKNFSKEIWKDINVRSAKLTDDTSIRTFQYKINNRILYTNDMLMKFKIKETELCTFCNETKETILHHLFECIHVKNIWIKLASNVRGNLNININLLPEYFVFNMFTGQEDECTLNKSSK